MYLNRNVTVCVTCKKYDYNYESARYHPHPCKFGLLKKNLIKNHDDIFNIDDLDENFSHVTVSLSLNESSFVENLKLKGCNFTEHEVIQQYMNGSKFRVKSVFPLSLKQSCDKFQLVQIYFTPTQIEGTS